MSPDSNSCEEEMESKLKYFEKLQKRSTELFFQISVTSEWKGGATTLEVNDETEGARVIELRHLLRSQKPALAERDSGWSDLPTDQTQ